MAKVVRALISKRPLRRGEERLLALLYHLRRVKDDWQSRITLNSSAQETQREIEELEQQIKHLESQGPFERVSFGNAFIKSKSRWVAVGSAAFIVLGIVTGANENSRPGAPLFMFLGISGGTVALLRTKQYADEANRVVDQKKNQIFQVRQALGEARKRYSAYAKQINDLPAELPNITLGSMLVPVESKSILGKNLVLDPTGLVNPSILKAIALRDLSEEVDRILAMTHDLETIPVLLQPDRESLAESRQFSHTLHGQERQLRQAVTAYVNTLGTFPDEELTVHAIKPDSKLGKIVAELLSGNETYVKEVADIDQLTITESQDQHIQSRIQYFEDLQRQVAAIATQALAQLDQINSQLKHICGHYNRARKESTNALHANYYRVLNRANWCSRKFYCPRTILSKSYLQALVGLDFDCAHRLDAAALVQCLHADSFISNRLNSKPHIIDDLLRSHESISQIMSHYHLVSDESGTVRSGNVAEYIIDQYNQELSLFRQRLVEALTGSPNGFLGISESARLFYDPVREIWYSPLLPYTYTNSEVQQYGQVLRTDVDLLIPLWEHLWTDKSDFRKSEHFRTNESIQRMCEKEGEKIKQIGYQFQADLREVRSNMFLAKADFDAKLQELEEYEDGIKELGLMDERQLARLQSATSQLESLRHESSGDPTTYEQILLLEPKNQLLRRQSVVHDPINVIKSPDLLIEASLERTSRRLLDGDQQEVFS